MKNPEINIVKKISEEQKKILFFAPIGLIILGIIGYVLFKPSNDTLKEGNEKISNKWDLPNDSKEDMPTNTTDIIKEVNKNNEKIRNAAGGGFFDDLENTTSSKVNENTTTTTTSSKDSLYAAIQAQVQGLQNKKAKIKQTSRVNNSQIRSTTTKINKSPAIIEPENSIDVNDFFSKKVDVAQKEKNSSSDLKTDNVIYAVIHGDQNVKTNERVELRLLKDATINGVIIKKNTFFYGFTSFSKNRVNLVINNINNIPINTVAYDTQDGNKGIYVKGANVIGEIGKEYNEDVLREVDASGVPLGQTVKSLLSKKAKESKVFLLNNYKLILKSDI